MHKMQKKVSKKIHKMILNDILFFINGYLKYEISKNLFI